MLGDQDGIVEQFSLAGGNTSTDRLGNRSSVYYSDRNHYKTGTWPQTGKWVIPPPSGMTTCEFDRKVIEVGRGYEQGEYNAIFGPNSNTAAARIIDLAGGQHYPSGAQAMEVPW